MLVYNSFYVIRSFLSTYVYVHHVTPNFRCRHSLWCRLPSRPDADRPGRQTASAAVVRGRRHSSSPRRLLFASGRLRRQTERDTRQRGPVRKRVRDTERAGSTPGRREVGEYCERHGDVDRRNRRPADRPDPGEAGAVRHIREVLLQPGGESRSVAGD